MEELDPSDGRLEGDILHDIVVGFSATWWAELLRYFQGQYASELAQSVFWHLVRRLYSTVAAQKKPTFPPPAAPGLGRFAQNARLSEESKFKMAI